MSIEQQPNRSEWIWVGHLGGWPLYRNQATGQYAIEVDHEQLRALTQEEEELLREQGEARDHRS